MIRVHSRVFAANFEVLTMSTERLYYHDSFLYDFDARVLESLQREGRHAIVLDRTAFYPTSGGQVHDLGMLTADGQQIADY